MNNPNQSCRQASLRALLPLLSAVCILGCSGQVSEEPEQGLASAGARGVLASGGATGVKPTPPVSSGGTSTSTPAGASGAAAMPNPAATATPAPAVGIDLSAKILSVNGSGCPSGSATITAMTADSLTLSVPAYSARLGGEADLAQRRQNCLLVLEVDIPAGYTYAVASASLSGSAALPAGVSGSAFTEYSFAGSRESVSNTQPITGDASKWTMPGAFPPASLVQASCEAPSFLSFNTALALTGDSDVASSISLDPSVTLKLLLKKCP